MKAGRDEIMDAMTGEGLADQARFHRKVGPSPRDIVPPAKRPQASAKAKAAMKRKAQRVARRITRQS